jgi:hypothetical protein
MNTRRELLTGVHVGINIRWNPARTFVRGPVLIGSGSSIGNGARIKGPCVTGAGV